MSNVLPCALCPRPRKGLIFCTACATAYRKANPDHTHAALIEWVAARTRRMERRFR